MSEKERIKRQKQQEIKQLGLRIKSIRIGMGLSITQFSALVNKDYQSIQRLEKGEINPSFFYLSQIATSLGMTLAELLMIEISKGKKK